VSSTIRARFALSGHPGRHPIFDQPFCFEGKPVLPDIAVQFDMGTFLDASPIPKRSENPAGFAVAVTPLLRG
jgi:hypothetical protein